MEAIFANLQNGLIFPILGVFERFFLHRLGIMSLLIVFGMFWAFFFTQSDEFAKMIAFSWKLFSLIFKLV